MRSFSMLLLGKLLFLSTIAVSAQSVASIYTVDTIKTFEGQQAIFLQFIEKNWAEARQKLKAKGKVKSYRVLSVKPDESLPWDVLLITEYPDRESFTKREEIFAEVFKTQPAVKINGKSGRDMSKIINKDAGYEQVLTSEKVSEIINQTELEPAKIPLNNYIQGQATGNGDLIRQAFWKDARIMAFRDDKLTNLSVEEFAARFTGKAADDEAKRRRWIESVEITGNAAVGKIVLDYPTVKFVDYMSLLKIGGEWKIINKSFYAELKNSPK